MIRGQQGVGSLPLPGVSRLWHRAPHPLVGGEMFSFVSSRQMNEGGDRRLGVGMSVVKVRFLSIVGCAQMETYPACMKVLVFVFLSTGRDVGVCIP